MIRILTLLVSLFTFGLVDLAEITYEIPVTDMLYFNDTPISTLNNKTLNEIFVDSQLYNLNNVSYSTPNPIYLGNGVWELQGNNSFDNGQLRLIMTDTSKYLDGTYYFRVDTKNISNTNIVLSRGFDIFSLNSWVTNFLITNANSVNTFSQNFNYVRANTTPNDRNRILLTTNSQTNNIQISPYFINLTSLGITATKTQMDRYFELWQNPELNITYEINQLDTQDLIILLASQSVWTIMIHLLYKYAYRPKKKSKRLGM